MNISISDQRRAETAISISVALHLVIRGEVTSNIFDTEVLDNKFDTWLIILWTFGTHNHVLDPLVSGLIVCFYDYKALFLKYALKIWLKVLCS